MLEHELHQRSRVGDPFASCKSLFWMLTQLFQEGVNLTGGSCCCARSDLVMMACNHRA